MEYHFDVALYETGNAITPLYEGSKQTVLQAVCNYFSWFTNHPSLSKEALSDMLLIQKGILPAENKLPCNYESALSVIRPYLLQPVNFHACRNDCVLFRNEYEGMTECPKCNSPRYKRKNIPCRQFTYLPIGPRLERMFGTSNLSLILQSHMSDIVSSTMFDIHDSTTWREAFSVEGTFKGDARGVALSLCTDGVNPFSVQRVSYSMWPIMLTILNLPRHIRNKFENILLVGIVPANGRLEPKSLEPYLSIVVDEILLLSNAKMYDAYREAPFSAKVDLLTFVLDYPGISKVFNFTGVGSYKGCVWCDIKGTYY